MCTLIHTSLSFSDLQKINRTHKFIPLAHAVYFKLRGVWNRGNLRYFASYFVQNLNSLFAPFSPTQKAFFDEEEFECSSTLTCSGQLLWKQHPAIYLAMYSYQKIFEKELVMNLVPPTGSGSSHQKNI